MCFPQALLDDPLYIGVPQKRVMGKAYDDLIDEFINAATQRYCNQVKSYLHLFIVTCDQASLLFFWWRKKEGMPDGRL